jgi:hypothetical protein
VKNVQGSEDESTLAGLKYSILRVFASVRDCWDSGLNEAAGAAWKLVANLCFVTPAIAHNVPANFTPIFLPSCALELNPVENIWQYLCADWLSNRVFETYGAIHRRRLRGLEQTHRAARYDLQSEPAPWRMSFDPNDCW